jgi:hypothetical protein
MLYICISNLGIMEPIKIGYSADEKLEILKTLSHFSPEDYPKVLEDDVFWENKFKLDLGLEKIHNGTAQFVSFEELDAMLEETISKYEN